MTQSSGTVAGTASASALSFPQRVVGVFTSPRATFESVVAYPKWLDVLAFSIVVGMAAFAAFSFSTVGSQAMLDQIVTQAEAGATARGGNPAQAAEQMRNFFPMLRIGLLAAIPIFAVVISSATAGLLYLIFAAMLGGTSSYKQVFAVVAHAGLTFQAAGLADLALQYAKGSMGARLSLGALVQMLPEDSFVFQLLNALTLGWIWYLVALSMGLAVLYRRKTATIATSFLGIYFVIAVIIAVFKSRA